jgi:hypothetical protein
MKGCLAGLAPVLLLAACSSGAGVRAECAYGGELVNCPESDRTAEGACWRLVDCAVIPLSNMNEFDWGNCVNQIETVTADRERIMIDCIAVSSCDELKVQGSPDHPQIGQLYCGFGNLQ